MDYMLNVGLQNSWLIFGFKVKNDLIPVTFEMYS